MYLTVEILTFIKVNIKKKKCKDDNNHKILKKEEERYYKQNNRETFNFAILLHDIVI